MIAAVAGDGISVHQAAAATQSLFFMLAVSAVALPVILFYTSYEYWIFRG